MLTNWTVLSAQTGKDSIVCYTPSELNKIADKIIFAHEADSLRKVAEKQIQTLLDQSYALDMTIDTKQKEIDAEKSIVVLKEDIISDKDIEIGGLNDIIKKSNNQLKWTRVGWISTTAVLTLLLLSR